MGCNCDNNSVGSTRPNNNDCIIRIVKDIVKAQHQAVESLEDHCFTGCDRSIAELLSPVEENRERFRHNTIPFMLTCKGNCKPFVGSGVRKVRKSGQTFFDCIESPVFRVKSFVRNSNTCVRLELLKPVAGGGGPSPKGQESCHSTSPVTHGTVCSFFPSYTRNFRATGICITVDLNCFCGISCLDPITPLPAQ